MSKEPPALEQAATSRATAFYDNEYNRAVFKRGFEEGGAWLRSYLSTHASVHGQLPCLAHITEVCQGPAEPSGQEKVLAALKRLASDPHIQAALEYLRSKGD